MAVAWMHPGLGSAGPGPPQPEGPANPRHRDRRRPAHRTGGPLTPPGASRASSNNERPPRRRLDVGCHSFIEEFAQRFDTAGRDGQAGCHGMPAALNQEPAAKAAPIVTPTSTPGIVRPRPLPLSVLVLGDGDGRPMEPFPEAAGESRPRPHAIRRWPSPGSPEGPPRFSAWASARSVTSISIAWRSLLSRSSSAAMSRLLRLGRSQQPDPKGGLRRPGRSVDPRAEREAEVEAAGRAAPAERHRQARQARYSAPRDRLETLRDERAVERRELHHVGDRAERDQVEQVEELRVLGGFEKPARTQSPQRATRRNVTPTAARWPCAARPAIVEAVRIDQRERGRERGAWW